MGPIGWPEMVFIFFLALLLFGPKKLPELARTVGKGVNDFKRLKSEWTAALDVEAKNLAEGTESLAGLVDHYRSEIEAIDSPGYGSSGQKPDNADLAAMVEHYRSEVAAFDSSAHGRVEAVAPVALLERAPAAHSAHGAELSGQLS
jgi:TatA/E family protein of Tat protein translocase